MAQGIARWLLLLEMCSLACGDTLWRGRKGLCWTQHRGLCKVRLSSLCWDGEVKSESESESEPLLWGLNEGCRCLYVCQRV